MLYNLIKYNITVSNLTLFYLFQIIFFFFFSAAAKAPTPANPVKKAVSMKAEEAPEISER